MGEIKIGRKVKLSIKTANGIEKDFDCFIKEVYTDRLSLDFPHELLNDAEYFEEGNEIPVKIYTPLGVKSFNAMVLDSPYEPEFTIEYVENSDDIQRREFVRVPFCVKIFVEKIDKTKVVGYTIDVSGGGVKFLADDDFIPDEQVKLTLYFPDEPFIQAKGMIIKSDYLPLNEHVISFTRIEEKDRDRIIKKCFEIQLAKE